MSAHPTPANLLAARKAAGLSQTEAGALVYVSLSTWARWERGEWPIPQAEWELFLIKTRSAK